MKLDPWNLYVINGRVVCSLMCCAGNIINNFLLVVDPGSTEYI